MSTLGAVLVGGRSTRMGADKADVEVDGRTMLDRVSEAMRSVASNIVILGPDHEGYTAWPDRIEAPGPISGIATALARSSHERVLVVAVDHPFVRPRTLAGMVAIESSLAVVPVDDQGVRQVTCAVYPRSIAPLAFEEARAGGSIQSLLDRVAFEPVTIDLWESWGEDGRSWYSVDTQDALNEGVRRFG